MSTKEAALEAAQFDGLLGDESEPVEMELGGAMMPQPQVEEIFNDADVSELPSGVGVRWRAIDPADKMGVWADLRKWVDWLITEYKLSKQQIPPCWYRHTDIVAELYAMRCAEEKAWESNEPQNTAAFQFHPHLFSMIQRLSNKAGKCLNSNKHVDAASFTEFPAEVLPYDENDWSEFLVQETETQTLLRGDEDLWWRRRVELVSEIGELSKQNSDPIFVPQRGPVPALELRNTQKLMETTTHVHVASTSYGKVNTSVWEFTTDPASNKWHELEVSKEDRTAMGTAYEDGPEDE